MSSKQIAKKQLSLILISKGVAYINADVSHVDKKGKHLTGVDAVTAICDELEWIKVSGSRKIRTHQIVEVMSPHEVEEQRRYQRGWYKKSSYWYNNKNEKCDETQESKSIKLEKKARLSDLRGKLNDKTITNEERDEAIKLKKDLNI